MIVDEELDKVEKKIHYLLSKQGIEEPSIDDYTEREMRHYYADKKRYKYKFDLYYKEFRDGKLTI